jgi:hypothetical protein
MAPEGPASGASAASADPWPGAPGASWPSSGLSADSAEAIGIGSSAAVPRSESSSPLSSPEAAPASDSAPSFDAIARAARSAPPSASEASPDENLPAPKGGLSPGMVAGQGLVSHGPVMAPSPRLEGNLPLPKERASHLYDLAPDASGGRGRGDEGGAPDGSTARGRVGGRAATPAGGSPGAPGGPEETEAVHTSYPGRTGPRGAPGLGSGISTGLTSPNLNAVHAPPGTTGDLARPFDADHYRRVYEEFVAAKTRIGESVEGLSFEGFGAKLRASEEGLIKQHACRAVRFQVLVKDHSVSLRPQLVR